MSVVWEITPQKVQKVTQKIIEISRPRKLILFGSFVRGNMHASRDIGYSRGNR